MSIFSKLANAFKTNNKKVIGYLPANESILEVENDSIKCSYSSYKTIASFDLNVEKPKYEGAIPEVTIKFYPLD